MVTSRYSTQRQRGQVSGRRGSGRAIPQRATKTRQKRRQVKKRHQPAVQGERGSAGGEIEAAQYPVHRERQIGRVTPRSSRRWAGGTSSGLCKPVPVPKSRLKPMTL